MFQNLHEIKEAGFDGFKSIEQLWQDSFPLPNERGIYLVVNRDRSRCSFLPKGVGGHFKEKDPNIALNLLATHWINNCHVLYIGQAGGNGSRATLKSRLKQYLDFGKGKPVGHYGGRLIWQLSHYKELIIAWKVTTHSDPREEEIKLMTEFSHYYGKLPFANLMR